MGDGRHRADPKGLARYVVAIGGIVLVLALVAAGGYALYSALTTEPGASPGSTSRSDSPAPSEAKGALDRARLVPAAPPTLALQIVGTRCYVSVRVPDGQILLNRTLRKGETARFDQERLEVTLGDSAAVRVTVNGAPRRVKDEGQVETFIVSRSDP